MNTSDKIDIISAALVSVQEEMIAIKDADNPFFKSKYAPLDEILKSVRPSLKEKGLTIVQSMESADSNLVCTTRVLHESGQWIDSTMSLRADKPTPQGFGSAATYARRYGICAALSISTPNEDDDGNKAEEAGEKAKAKATKEAEKKKSAEALDSYKGKVLVKLAAYNPDDLREAFSNSGYESSADDFDIWIGDVVAQVNSRAKLDAIGVAVKEKSNAAS